MRRFWLTLTVLSALACDSERARDASTEPEVHDAADAAADASSELDASNDASSTLDASSDASSTLDASSDASHDQDAEVRDAQICDAPDVPDVVLRSSGGEQIGVQVSYCIGMPGVCGFCVDNDVAAYQVTVVHPGDEVTFEVPAGATLVPSRVCETASCPPTLRIRSSLCGAQEMTRTVQVGEPWRIDLLPATYALSVESSFELDGGWEGSLSTELGLLVDETAERDVIEADSDWSTCE